MPNKIFELQAGIKGIEETEKGLKIQGMASTNAVDRAGDVIAKEAWEKGGLDNFKNNPIILFNHDYNQPIGKATNIEVTDNGLEITAMISKAAGRIYGLIKDGVLGAFSVSFLIKDADYIEETYGLLIKDAELLENSVVSIPCNQAATFSLAKSFDSSEEYNDFKKTFTNSVAGQSGDTEKENSLDVSKDTPAGAVSAQMEINMTPEELKALAEKVAAEAAGKAAEAIKIQQDLATAKAKAAAEAQTKADKQAATVASLTNAEQLVADLEAKMTAKDADLATISKEHADVLKEKADELDAMRNSKRVFLDRNDAPVSIKTAIAGNSDEFVQAKLLGTITGKGWDTDFAKDLMEKTGINYTTDTTTGDLDQEVIDLIQKDIWMQTKVASLFREIPVNGRATVLPVQRDSGYAAWSTTGVPNGNLINRGNLPDETDTALTYNAGSVTMLVDRMISSTYMDNDIDEKTLVNLMPMLTEGVARAHARRVEAAIMYPSNSGGVVTHVTDLEAAAAASGTVSTAPAATAGWTAANLMNGRAAMGKYGLNPTDVAYVVAMEVYYDLINDPEFQNLNEVGEIATKLRGVVGGIFGSPVLVSEEFPAGDTTDAIGAYVVNRNNYVIPRLRGITVERDYEVMNQRQAIVSTQSLGFTELFAGDSAGNEPVVSIAYAAS